MVAIQMTYVNYNGMWEVRLDPLTNLPDCRKMETSFPKFGETFLLLFSNLFGYGEVETTEIFQPNLRFPKKSANEEDRFLAPSDMLKFR